MMILIAVVAGYLIGTIPFALLVSNQWGVDLRHTGSGNLGAANVMRASGVRSGVLVAALDMAKGAASVWLAERLTSSPAAPAAAGLAAIIGHIYPLWLHFRGGKGVATAVRCVPGRDAAGDAAGPGDLHGRGLDHEVHLARFAARDARAAADRLRARQPVVRRDWRERVGRDHRVPASIEPCPDLDRNRTADWSARLMRTVDRSRGRQLGHRAGRPPWTGGPLGAVVGARSGAGR